MFCAISISCAASRATWAFARDKAIPFYTHFGKISMHPCFPDVPVNALVLSTTIQVLLGLIYLGSSTAFNAFVGVAVMCLGASYALPVAISLVQGRTEVADAPFGLGQAGVVVNAIAVAWVVFAIVLFSMPAVVPVTQVTMSACLPCRCGVADVRGERVFVARLCLGGVCRLCVYQRGVVHDECVGWMHTLVGIVDDALQMVDTIIPVHLSRRPSWRPPTGPCPRSIN